MSRVLALFCAFALCLLPLASAGAQGFTLEQVTSAPFSSELHAAPKGDRFVWIVNQRGHRNLFVAENSPRGYISRALTHDDADDGIDLGDITWTPDGASVIYVRGGDFEFPNRPAPNPALLPGGVTQEIWLAPCDGGQPRILAEGRAPAVSPDGATVAFLRNGQIFSLSLRDPAAKPAQLFHARGDLDSLLWSPDGRRLAFTSGRGDHGFIGIYTVATNSLLYLDPSTDTDDDPVWSPDSQHIAFIRLTRDPPGTGFRPHRTGTPWSILIADAETGNARELWRAHEGQGSAFRELGNDQQLFWCAGDRIVFPWEADGWLHLYAMRVGGGTPVLLTPGSSEVEYVALNPDGSKLIYASNENAGGPEGAQDIDRRHIWQVSADSNAPAHPLALTHGSGIEVHPAISSAGTIAVLRSDPHIPLRAAVLASKGELHDLAPQLLPASFPASKLVIPHQVIFSAADGMQIHGQLFLPRNLSDGHRHPAVVFFHGGSRREMLLGWHYMYYYSNSYAMNQFLASQGYIVLSVNYRSGIGYGLDFREALNYGAAGASEFNDVLGAGLYLRSRSDVDPAETGVWGGSYGGYLTALALARASDLFAAGVDLHGVHDWNLSLTVTNANGHDADASRLAFESSPLASINTWRSPVLLIQGDDDRNVSFTQTVRLAQALRARGVPVEEHVFPDEIHDFLLYRDWLEAYRLGADFFGRKLVPKTTR